MDSLFRGHNWVYTIHIVLVSPLLLYISIGYLFDMKVNEGLYTFMMYTLLAFAVLMILYHGNKLRNNL
jgi:hypothetical protein